MKKFICFVLCLIMSLTVFVSCAQNTENTEKGGEKSGSSSIRPADYAEGDLTYELSISDGYRKVTLEVKREGAVTTAAVTSPASMTGVSVIYDAAGMRMSAPEGEEIPITPEAGAGLAVFFDAVAHPLTKEERQENGKYSLTVSDCPVTLMLSEDGYPCLIELTWCGVKRCAEITGFDSLS